MQSSHLWSAPTTSTHRRSEPGVVSLCMNYINCHGCPGACGRLHMCRKYILGDVCPYSQQGLQHYCKYNHNIFSNHNKPIVTQHQQLCEESDAEKTINNIRQWLQDNRTYYTMPSECQYYCSSTICKMNHCHKMHVCKYFLKSICTRSNDNQPCRRSHDIFNHNNIEVLKEYGFPTQNPVETLKKLKTGYDQINTKQKMVHDFSSRRSIERPSQPNAITHKLPLSHPLNHRPICLDDLQEKCPLGINCLLFHEARRLTYCWQHKAKDDRTWGFFSHYCADQLEQAYCDMRHPNASRTVHFKPAKGVEALAGTVHFYDMTLTSPGGDRRLVRRMATPSSSLHAGDSNATTWRWFRMDKQENVIEFDAKSSKIIDQKFWTQEPRVELPGKYGTVTINLFFMQGYELGCGGASSGFTVFRCPTARQHVMPSGEVQLDQYRRQATKVQALPVQPEEKDTEEIITICTDFLDDKCTSERKCPHYHSMKPYQWRYQPAKTWKPFGKEENQSLEKAFRDINKSDATVTIDGKQQTAKISFVSMTMQALPTDNNDTSSAPSDTVPSTEVSVQRLSTPSTVQHHNPHCTVWQWYVRGQDQGWRDVEHDGVILSKKLESIFLKGTDKFEMLANGEEYVINFETMKMINLTKNLTSHLARRPTDGEAMEVEDKPRFLCTQFLQKACSTGKQCRDLHSCRPFLWQYRESGKPWINMQDAFNNEAEKAYCDVTNTSINMDKGSKKSKLLDFMTMTMTDTQNTQYELRRVEVQATDDVTSNHLSTRWRWYQSEDGEKSWIEVANDSKQGITGPVLEKKLKEYRLDETKSTLTIYFENQLHQIDFASMTRKSEDNEIIAYYRRRPMYNLYNADIKCELAGLQDEICVDFLLSKCTKDRDCLKYHSVRKYQWFYQCPKTRQWKTLRVTNETIEKEYCKPESDSCILTLPLLTGGKTDLKLSFKTMKATESETVMEIKRLSTPSTESFAASNARSDIRVKSSFSERYGVHEMGNRKLGLTTTMAGLGRKTATDYDFVGPKRITVSTATYDTTLRTEADNEQLTVWVWYWLDNDSWWQPYVGEINKILERHYLQDQTGKYSFQRDEHTYVVDFSQMTQTNKNYKTVRNMKRRPLYDSQVQQQQLPLPCIESFPEHWVEAPIYREEKEYTLRKLSITSVKSQYEREELMRLLDSIPEALIGRVLVVLNKEMWENYHRCKSKMQSSSNGKPPQELLLFHALDSKYADAICKQGFDWRILGSKVMTSYGKGNYFSRDAKSSNVYKHPTTKGITLFGVHVLVGDYVKGQSSYVRPPPKDAEKPLENLYDSCVDNVTAPSLHVVFNSHQAYPAYIMEY